MRPGLTPFSLRVRIAVLCPFVAALVTCDGSSTDVTVTIPVATVEVAPGTGTVEIGQTLQLTATPKDATGNVLHRTVTWSSSDPAVATADGNGLVTGVLEGTAIITATSEGMGGAATVRVIELGAYNCSVQSQIPEVECWALAALYNATNGPGWDGSTGWLASTTPCSWRSVTCTDGVVTELNLDMNRLMGTIPAELGNLSNLRELQLANNQLTGSIPVELGNLSKLEALTLSYNQLAGPIPPVLGKLSSLQKLGLYNNQLTGPIPPVLRNLSNLQKLGLHNNQLTGPIPTELGNLSNLEVLTLDNNQLTGPIPPEFGNLSKLEALTLSSNQLTGPIPPELGNLSKLWWLYLGGNQLAGPIPPELENLSLLSLNLESNQLTGPIPPELGNLSGLSNLSLGANQLTGAIPPELGNLSRLWVLDLSGNQLSNLVPLEVAQRGGQIQDTHGANSCVFTPPGNDGLNMPDTQDYRDADLDGDGLICGLGFTAVLTSAVVRPNDPEADEFNG